VDNRRRVKLRRPRRICFRPIYAQFGSRPSPRLQRLLDRCRNSASRSEDTPAPACSPARRVGADVDREAAAVAQRDGDGALSSSSCRPALALPPHIPQPRLQLATADPRLLPLDRHRQCHLCAPANLSSRRQPLFAFLRSADIRGLAGDDTSPRRTASFSSSSQECWSPAGPEVSRPPT